MELLSFGPHAFHKTHGLGLKTLFDCQRPKPFGQPVPGRLPPKGAVVIAALEPPKILVELIGIEPTTSGLQSPRSPS